MDIVATTDSKTQTKQTEEPELTIRCALCGHDVTHSSYRIEISGSHEHMQCNPAGITFVFGCFRDAPGCLSVGEAEREHSWFEDHYWQVALCENCHGHLGWCFTSPSSSPFFGLILARLLMPH